MGGDNVERELAEAFERQREATEKWGNRLEAKLEEIQRQAQDHYREDAAMFATLDASARSAHKRMDDHDKVHENERSGRVQLWIGVVLSLLSATLASLVAMFGGKKP